MIHAFAILPAPEKPTFRSAVQNGQRKGKELRPEAI